MAGTISKHLPRFSTGELLLLTAAAAIGLAVAFSPEWQREYWEADLRIPHSLMTSGCVLLVVELLGQSRYLTRQYPAVTTDDQHACVHGIAQRVILAMFIAFLVMFRVLLSRGVVIKVERISYAAVYVDFWPDLMFPIAVLTTLQLFTNRHSSSAKRNLRTGTARAIVFVGLALLLFFAVTERNENLALDHFAASEIEHAASPSLRRAGAFPDLRLERFRTVWISAAYACLMLVAGGCLWSHASIRTTFFRRSCTVAFGSIVCAAVVYIYWFVRYELPRISPDLAGVQSWRMWFDTVAGLMLLTGLSFVLGKRLARMDEGSNKSFVDLPRHSKFLVLGITLIATAAAWQINILVYLWTFLQLPESFFWLPRLLLYLRSADYAGMLFSDMAGVALQPELLLWLGALISCFSFLVRKFRKPELAPQLEVISNQLLCGYSLAVLLLLIVALPCFAIFGFCYWLGPWF